MSRLWLPKSPRITRRHFLRSTAAVSAAAGLGLAGLPGPLRATTTARHGGTATILISSEPPVITTIAHTAFNSVYVSPKINEGLVDYDFDLNPIPQLATEWSVSEDGLSYHFSLRPNVRWHDGQPFTSADVAFSLLTAKEVHPRGRNTFANLTEVRTPDDLTVELVLSRPAPFLLTALAAAETPIVARHLYEGTDIPNNPVNNAPVGTGPFRFVEWARGSHITYERNPDYWDNPRPYLDRLIFRFIPDVSARAIAVETGEVDYAPGLPIPLSEVERFQTLDHLTFDTRGYGYNNGVTRIDFNLEKPYFQDVRVRRAFAHTIDREVIRDVIQYGVGETIPGPIARSLTPWFVEDLPTYAIDTRRAERLLDEAGFQRGTDGVRLRVIHDYVPSGDHFRRGAEYIRQALAQIGVEATVRSQDFATYTRRKYTERDFDFTFNGMSNLFDPAVGVQRLYWSKNFRPGVPFSNGSGYNNPRVDELLETASVTPDYETRFQLYREFQEILVEDLPDFGVTSGVGDVTIATRRLQDHTTGATGAGGSFAHAWLADA